MRRLLGALLGLAAVPLAARASLGPRYGGEIVVGVAELVPTEAPVLAQTTDDRLLLGMVHERLLDVEPDGTVQRRLADGWASAADGREWSLRLRPGLTFHDGGGITGADAVRSIRRFLRTDSPAARRLAADLDGGGAFAKGATETLAGLAVDDAGQVVLRYRAPLATPLAPLASLGAAVTSSGGAGAGPFVPVLRLPTRLGFTAFAGHLGGRPFLDAAHVAVAAPRAQLSELQAGRIDAFAAHAPGSDPCVTLLLVLDPARPPFHDPDTRTAVREALDVQGLVQNFWSDAEAARGLLAPTLLAPEVPASPRPPAAAPTLRGAVILRVGSDVPPLVSQRVVAHLQDLGLEVAAAAVPPREVWTGRAHARLVLWSPEVAEPGLALQELLSLGEGKAAEGLLAEAWETRDAARRRGLLDQAQSALRAHAVVLPVAWVPVAWRARDGVQGLRVARDGRPVVEDAWRQP